MEYAVIRACAMNIASRHPARFTFLAYVLLSAGFSAEMHRQIDHSRHSESVGSWSAEDSHAPIHTDSSSHDTTDCSSCYQLLAGRHSDGILPCGIVIFLTPGLRVEVSPDIPPLRIAAHSIAVPRGPPIA